MGVGFTSLSLIRDTACMDSYWAANKLRLKECISVKKKITKENNNNNITRKTEKKNSIMQPLTS